MWNGFAWKILVWKIEYKMIYVKIIRLQTVPYLVLDNFANALPYGLAM